MIGLFANHNITLVHPHHVGQIHCPEFLPKSSAAELLTCANLLGDKKPLRLLEDVHVFPLQHFSDYSSRQLFLFCRSADSRDSFSNVEGMNDSFFHVGVNFARRSFLLSDCLPCIWFSKDMDHSWFWAYGTKVFDNLSKLFPDFSWDKMKFRVSLDCMLYQNEWIYFEAANLHILFAEQYPIHLCKSKETWPLPLNARDRNSLRSKYLEDPIFSAISNNRLTTLMKVI